MILDDIVQNFEKINRHFGLELWESSKCFRGKCPIHEGDNKSSLTIYKDGHTSPGNWKCFTGNCQEEYGGSVIGFISAILSVRGNRKVSKQEAISWCESFFGSKYQAPDNSFDNKLTNFINRSAIPKNPSFRLSVDEFYSKLEKPLYFINRNYKEETLFDFKVGICNNKQKPFYNRVIVPQFDKEKYVIGCLGRSIYEKCSLCKEYHNPEGVCRTFAKWKNSEGFDSYGDLYNFHSAKQYINDTGIAIITESSANTWRLHESGFKMAIGTFGAKFSDAQKAVLDTSLAQTIVVVPDADEAGKILVKHIIEQCQYTHNIVTINPSYKDDVGALNVETVKQIIGPYIDKYNV